MRRRSYFGKNRFRWSAVPIISHARTQQHNIVLQGRVLKPPYCDILNESTKSLDLWNLLFRDEMLDIIVLYTNKAVPTKI